MPKKIIIINWSFQIIKDEKLAPEETKEYQIVDSSEDLIITCNMNEIQIENFQNLVNKIKKSNDKNILVMLHKDNKILESNIKETTSNLSEIKIREFGGGSNAGHPIYDNQTNLGLLGGSKLVDKALTNDTIESQEIKKVKKEHFEFVWDYYWNQLDLENQKKKIINLWLPLAIDIQGLNELFYSNVSDKQIKIETYLKEIETDIEQYADSHKNKWEEIKKILLPADDGKEVLDEKYRLTKEGKKKVKFPVDNIDANSLKNFVQENYKDNGKSHFLPKWLQEVVNVIDRDI